MLNPARDARRRAPWRLSLILPALLWVAGPAHAQAEAGGAPPATVRVVNDAEGSRLQVDGRDFMVYGMNWDYIPIGHNYQYDFWSQPDDMIEAALATEMGLLKDMGVNVIRVYAGMPRRWIEYVHDRYGIFTVLNHTVGRYGFTLDGAWTPVVDYSEPRMRAAIKADVVKLVEEFRGTRGLLMWLLGNENNYGLSWKSFEIEALPKGERDAARARHLYSLFGEVITAVKASDPSLPVAMANGDVQYIDIIAEECKGLDVFGSNVYRGISSRDLFDVVKAKLGVPMMYTEFGADAFNTREMREDQASQARYLIGQWQEVYEQSSGKGRAGNAIGGFVFQWSDGWWKFGQESRLDVHDTNASWPNGGYVEDFVEGDNNMNEEWWGICAKGPADERGLFRLYPRAAYYAMRRAFRLPAYAPGTDLAAIRAHFSALDPMSAVLEARGDAASLQLDALSRVRLTGVRMQLETITTGAIGTTTPTTPGSGAGAPSFKGFDKMQSFYLDAEARPAANVTGMVSVNVLGHVPENPIDEIFYENRGRTRTITADGQSTELQGIERVKVYRAAMSWEDRDFRLDGFYRTGHYHWGYEGDFFGLYREANYGANIDIYNGEAPVGFELAGKRRFDGLKLAFGQELWWGANPALLVKYRRAFGPYTATALYQEDLASQSSVVSSNAIPQPSTRKATMAVTTRRGLFDIEVGGIWSGQNKVGTEFQIARETPGGYDLLLDEVYRSDAFGAKAKVSFQRGRWNWYAQAARMGLVADGGPTQVTTFTNWYLRDVGTGNQTNFLTGLAVNLGHFQVAPNFLWQKPTVGPIPGDVPAPGVPRNILDDPFAVRGNRETFGAEMLIGYDPTPATWMWAWDNDIREDARLAASLGFTYRHHPTTQDVAIGILADGRTTFAFPNAPPARDLWEMRLRLASRARGDLRIVSNLFYGTGEPNGSDPRLITRYGGEARVAYRRMQFAGHAKFNDWGPYDYHRDFNLTFPVQLMGDLSHTLGPPRWFGHPQTRIGVRGVWRSLDRNSPRYSDPSGLKGDEYEIRTYLTLAI